MSALILNTILYLGILFYYIKKDSILSIRVFVSLLYFLFALIGVITVQNGIYFETFGYYSVKNVSFVPYLLNFVMVVFMLNLLKNIDRYVDIFLKKDLNNSRLSKIVEYITMVACFIFLFLVLLWYTNNKSLSFADIYINKRSGEQMFSNGLLNMLYHRVFYFLKWITPVYFMFQYAKIVNGKASLYKLLFFFAVIILKSLVGADRGTMFFSCLDFIFFIIIFYKYLSYRIKKQLIIVCSCSFFAIVLVLESISYSRFESGNSTYESGTIRYFGEVFPNLGLRIWNVSNDHIMGARRFPRVYKALGGKVPDFKGDISLEREYFESKYKFPVNNFKSFYGDLYIEFGKYLSIIIFLLLYIILNHLKKNNINNGMSLLYVYIAYSLCTWGFFGCAVDERFVANVILYILFCYFTQKKSLIANTSIVRL